jgi:hypothetical protein
MTQFELSEKQLSCWTEARKSDYGHLIITAAQAVDNCVTVALQGRLPQPRAPAISNTGLFHLQRTSNVGRFGISSSKY